MMQSVCQIGNQRKINVLTICCNCKCVGNPAKLYEFPTNRRKTVTAESTRNQPMRGKKSTATAVRQAAGLAQAPANAELSAQRRLAAAKRWGKAKGKDAKEINAISAMMAGRKAPSASIAGGKAVIAQVNAQVQSLMQKAQSDQIGIRNWIVQEFTANVPAIVRSVLEIATGKVGAPAERLAAARFVLGEARLLAENLPDSGIDKPSGEKSLDELESEVRELEARIRSKEATAASVAIVTDAEILPDAPQVPDSIDEVSDTESGTLPQGVAAQARAGVAVGSIDLDDALT